MANVHIAHCRRSKLTAIRWESLGVELHDACRVKRPRRGEGGEAGMGGQGYHGGLKDVTTVLTQICSRGVPRRRPM